MVPLVQVRVREHFRLDSATTKLGANPHFDCANDSVYANFFTEFDTSLARLDQNIAADRYGCPSAACTQAQALSVEAHAVRDALYRSVYCAGAGA